ncbi:MAG: hypothetical protein N4A63_09800 [Vallitalea sp.]|jgi:bla regulator protein BlaR1|nr:hypothetical protein [Vallitalea sp.]MCT4597713.1 hypothetical protein [Vallitalea sp.]
MKNLIKYELKRDRVYIISALIGVIIILNICSLLDIEGFNGIILMIGTIVVLAKRSSNLAKDTVTEDREHMMLIPKSTSRIVFANAIVSYIDCIILGGILLVIMDIKIIKLWMLLRVFVAINGLFLFYQITTLLYIVFLKRFRTSISSILTIGMSITILFVFIVNRSIHIVLYSVKLSNTIFILFAILCIMTNAFIIGHKYLLSKIETKIMIGVIGLLIICSSTILYSYSQFDKFYSELPYEKDENIIGSWETVDFIEDYKDYTPKKDKEDLYLQSLTFKENGAIDKYPTRRWTKGYIYYPFKDVGGKYILKEINGDTYMFMEWKSGDYVHFNMKPKYYVLKKIL